jgi:hypothetical protein
MAVHRTDRHEQPTRGRGLSWERLDFGIGDTITIRASCVMFEGTRGKLDAGGRFSRCVASDVTAIQWMVHFVGLRFAQSSLRCSAEYTAPVLSDACVLSSIGRGVLGVARRDRGTIRAWKLSLLIDFR